MTNVQQLCEGVCTGNRRSLAKAITLIESSVAGDRRIANTLLESIMPKTGNARRIAISGVPGVGKSTFIERLGLRYANSGHQIAVLAIDPSSPISGGSILGDKTRMELLTRHEHVFIRPSPTKGGLGGVARRTREAMLLCEAAGYDYIIVETVGVGQSEVAAASMVDLFLMLQLPNAGDELQGIKKGILELADIVVVNKADGQYEQLAESTRLEQERALHLVRSKDQWVPPVLKISAKNGTGFTELDASVNEFFKHGNRLGLIKAKRQRQARQWFDQELIAGAKDWFLQQPGLDDQLKFLEEKVVKLELPAATAVGKLFSWIDNR